MLGALTIVVSGVILISGVQLRRTCRPRVEGRRQFFLPLGGALSAGIGLYATGHVSALALPIVVLPPRLVGFVVLTVPLLATQQLHLSRSVLPFVLGPAITEVGGFFLYSWGASGDIAVAAVLQSTFGAVAAVLGFVVLREKLKTAQAVGIVAITVGVAAVTLLTSM